MQKLYLHTVRLDILEAEDALRITHLKTQMQTKVGIARLEKWAVQRLREELSKPVDPKEKT